MKWLILLFFLGYSSAISTYAIKLAKGVDPTEFALEHNIEFVDSVLDYHVFISSKQDTNFLLHDNVISYNEQKKRKQYKRSTDPLYAAQWHLHSDYSVDFDINSGQDGDGITLAIVDDGFQHSHPDLSANYVASLSYDFNDRDFDPAPTGNDGHGTSAAGVAGARRNNNHCGTGVASKVSLAGIRLIAAGTYDYEEAQAMTHKNQFIDIYSCSWGPIDEGSEMAGPGRVTQDALVAGATNGRHGKGSLFIWAGGNGKHALDNGNYDGYANHWATFAIGALNFNGKQSWYSEDCACLMAVAPSSGSPGRGIRTVDLKGSRGYSRGECTNDFGGTSSAAPLAAGIMALVLGKRPELTARDVQHIIAKSATKIQTNDPDWSTPNAKGYSHSHHYGFGLLKIPAILAETGVHTLVPAKKVLKSPTNRYNTLISTMVSVGIPGHLSFVEQVLVNLEYSHRRHGDIKLELIHPNGATSILADRHADRHGGTLQWTYSTVRHWGETHTNNGQWSVKITDTSSSSSGRLKSVQINLIGF